MASILIVDDEQILREELEIALTAAGHMVMTAADGRGAIETGCRYRPDVLVADWMLTDEVNGLCVADALRLMHREMAVVLISGFISEDLRNEAYNKKVFEIIEKPFEVKRIRNVISRALRERPASYYGSDLPIGIMEIDPSGVILHANEYAGELIKDSYLREDSGNIYDLFWERTEEILERSLREWVKVVPFGSNAANWYIRGSLLDDSVDRMYVLLDDADRNYQNFPAVKMILGLSQVADAAWPVEEHVLIIDGDPQNRRRVAGVLRDAGCSISHVASNTDEGIRILARDPNVKLVVVGAKRHDSAGLTVRKLKGIRPDVSVVECG
jgi:DNA-binding response OmpR family regulator